LENDFVSLGRGAEEKRRFGDSTETNQWLVNLCLARLPALRTHKECNARTFADNDPNLWVESLALTRHSPPLRNRIVQTIFMEGGSMTGIEPLP
jgi:hypothetical protein